jgi:hypothetical protein
MDLAQREKRQYSKTELIFGNFAIAIWILLGTAAFWPFISYGALIYLALAGFLVFYELGKKGCVNCFWCKTCTIGMGKLPRLFFTQTPMETLNINRKALKLFPYVYLLLSVVPIVITAVSVIQGYTVYNAALLVALAVLSILTGTLRRKLLINH